MPHYDLLVIGGDAAGMSAASQARRMDSSMTICVIEKGEHVSYAACGMPYYISGVIENYRSLVVINAEEFITKRKIQILRETEARSLDVSSKRVIAGNSSGEDVFTYDRLVIATGASSAAPPIEGVGLPGVMFLKNLSDGIKIRNHIEKEKPGSAIIIGGGLIGLELSESFRTLNIDVTIIEKAEDVAPVFSPEIRRTLTQALEKENVKLVTGAGVTSIKQNQDGYTVHTDKGSHTADIVIISTGVRPNTQFLKDSSLELLQNGAVIVDEKCRTSVPGIFAAGDCATVNNLITGKTDYIPMATNANKQGRVAGLQAGGVETEVFKGAIGTQFVKVFELQAAKTGFNRKDAEKHMIPVITEFIEWKSRAGYYPGAEKINVMLTVREDNRKIIGGEISGNDGAALRINPLSVAITAGMTIDDFAYVDLGYSPPFAPVWDPLIAVAQNFIKRVKTVL